MIQTVEEYLLDLINKLKFLEQDARRASQDNLIKADAYQSALFEMEMTLDKMKREGPKI